MSSVNTLAAQSLQAMFARSATLQSEAGASAGTRVHFGATPNLSDQSAYPRPLVIIGFTEDYRQHMIAGGERNQLRSSGTLTFFGIRNTPSAYITGDSCDYSAAEVDHMNFFGSMLEDVAALSGWDDNLSVTDIALRDFAEVDAKHWKELGRFYIASGLVFWGDEARRAA